MNIGDPAKAYRVEGGKPVDLAKIDPGDQQLCPDGNKHNTVELFDSLRDEIQALQKVLYAESRRRVLVVVQAMDTGGKDGLVKHVFSRVDPQGIQVKAFKAPTADELAHDFLWRIHPHVPGSGQIMIFNRSHYEDIIAVRVKKIFGEEVWKRRYRHVIEFERMLAEEGTTILKLFLHISKGEQKRRLESRLVNPTKRWKFEPEDLRDRKRWDDFMAAYGDLIGRTSTPESPWFVIPANRKWYRNLCVARLFADTLKGLGMEFPAPKFEPGTLQIED